MGEVRIGWMGEMEGVRTGSRAWTGEVRTAWKDEMGEVHTGLRDEMAGVRTGSMGGKEEVRTATREEREVRSWTTEAVVDRTIQMAAGIHPRAGELRTKRVVIMMDADGRR